MEVDILLIIPFDYKTLNNHYTSLSIIIQAILLKETNLLVEGLLEILDDHPDKAGQFIKLYKTLSKSYNIINELIQPNIKTIENYELIDAFTITDTLVLKFSLSELLQCNTNLSYSKTTILNDY